MVVHVCVCVCVCVCERERESTYLNVCVCACVCVCVCVCVCERERERESTYLNGCICLFVCVCARTWVVVCVCVCVCVHVRKNTGSCFVGLEHSRLVLFLLLDCLGVIGLAEVNPLDLLREFYTFFLDLPGLQFPQLGARLDLGVSFARASQQRFLIFLASFFGKFGVLGDLATVCGFGRNLSDLPLHLWEWRFRVRVDELMRVCVVATPPDRESASMP